MFEKLTDRLERSFKILKGQDNREPEYVQVPDKN